MLWRMWSEGNTPPLLRGVETCKKENTLQINVALSQKKQNKQTNKQTGIVLSQDPAIPLLGINTKDSPSSHKDTCSTVFKQLYLLYPETGNNLDVPQLKNR